MSEAYYLVRGVRTWFDNWLGCDTKLCRAHKRNKWICHIRPETEIHPIGNGLYECNECHNNPKKPRSLRDTYGPRIELSEEMTWRMYNAFKMSESEQRLLKYYLEGLKAVA